MSEWPLIIYSIIITIAFIVGCGLEGRWRKRYYSLYDNVKHINNEFPATVLLASDIIRLYEQTLSSIDDERARNVLLKTEKMLKTEIGDRLNYDLVRHIHGPNTLQ